MEREVVSYGTRGCLRAAEALLDVLLPTSRLALTFLCVDAMRVPVHRCNGFVYGMSARRAYAVLIRIEALVPMVAFRPIHSLHLALPSHSPGPTLKVARLPALYRSFQFICMPHPLVFSYPAYFQL
jgi:hypothetical protein